MLHNSEVYKKVIFMVFLAGIICEFLVSFSGALVGGYKEPIIILAGMGLFCLTSVLAYDYKSIFTKQSIIELLVYIVVIAYSLLCHKYQHSALLLRISLILISSRILIKRGNQNIDNTILKVFFFGTGIVLLTFAILSALGMYGSLSVTQNFRHIAETRYCFGFFHPNGFSMFYIKFILLGIFLYGNKLGIKLSIALSVVLSIPLVLSNSRTSLLCYGFVCLALILIKLFKRYDLTKVVLIISIIIIFSLIVLTVLTIFMKEIDVMDGHADNLWELLNELSSGRLNSMTKSFNAYQVNLFGYGNTLETTENGYVNAMFSEGMIFVCIFIFASIWLLYRMYKEKNNIGIIVVTAVIISLFSESFMAYFNKNIVWMIMMGYVGSRSDSVEKSSMNVKEETTRN